MIYIYFGADRGFNLDLTDLKMTTGSLIFGLQCGYAHT